MAALRNAIGPIVAAARNHRRLVESGADAAALKRSRTRPRCAGRSTKLCSLSRATPSRGVASDEYRGDHYRSRRPRTRLSARGAAPAKATALAAAIPPKTPPPNAAAARARRDALVAALRAALDGEAQPVLPPVQRVPETTPCSKPSPPRVEPGARGVGPGAREGRTHHNPVRGSPWRAHATTDAATGADAPDADERADEGIAPRAHLFGTFVSKSNPAAAATFTGFIADEWAEQRPSRMQQTGIAINYDSPQSEPPQVLLLCEPAGPAAPRGRRPVRPRWLPKRSA